jgi:hypothetical protein
MKYIIKLELAKVKLACMHINDMKNNILEKKKNKIEFVPNAFSKKSLNRK